MSVGNIILIFMVILQIALGLEIAKVKRDIDQIANSFELHNVMLETTWKDVEILNIKGEEND